MRARAAYISSFGTTGILVASALLMLAMVSALVAFHAWPGSVPGNGVDAVPLAQRPQRAVSLDVVRKAAPPTHAQRTRAARRASTAGLVKVRGARPHAVMGELVKVPRGSSGPSVGMTPAPGRGSAHAPPQGSAPLPGDPTQLPGGPQLPSAPTNQVQNVVDDALGQLPPPPGSQSGTSVTLPTLENGQPVTVGVSVGSTSVSIGLP